MTAYVEYENGATGLFVTSTGEAGDQPLELSGDRGKFVEDDRLVFWRLRVSSGSSMPHTRAGSAVLRLEMRNTGDR